MIQRRGNTDLETNLNHLTRQKLHATHNKCCGPPALRVGVKLSRELHSWKCQWKPIFRASQPGENPLRISIDICTLKEPLRSQAAQTHYMNADVTLACERCCVTNGYLQRLVLDRSVFLKRDKKCYVFK